MIDARTSLDLQLKRAGKSFTLCVGVCVCMCVCVCERERERERERENIFIVIITHTCVACLSSLKWR